jgi:hypothetical protein
MCTNRPKVILLTLTLVLASAGCRKTADPESDKTAPLMGSKPVPSPVGQKPKDVPPSVDRPIPQNPERQRQRYRDMLAWNQKTLAGAYDRVGKKDPRWDKPAREALDAAARFFSHVLDPCVKLEEVYTPARRAVDAGCDDPLVLYVYARTSYIPNYPGPEELERRYTAAAVALEGSAYPTSRRTTALSKAAEQKAARKDLLPEVRKEAVQFLDAALGLLAKSAEEDERNLDLENHWFEQCRSALEGYRKLSGDYEASFARVDAVLAKTPALKALRLQLRGAFLIKYAWEARGIGFADTVTEERWKKFHERIAQAREALDEAWQIMPGDTRTATLMLTVEKGIGGNREAMEKWFERAMKADGNNTDACMAKMDWLDPKWHGSREDLLAFGRSCRHTKNWRAGITLLAANAHLRVSKQLPPDQQREYFNSPEVRDEIEAVYEEYLKHYPNDHAQRSFYAAYCFMCGRYANSDKHFRVVGDSLAWSDSFPEEWMKQVRHAVSKRPKPRPD